MNIMIEPTPEMYSQKLADGREVPLRVWHGVTDSGLAIEAYVFAIVPEDAGMSDYLRAELPPFMRPAREQYDLVVPKSGEQE